MKKIIGYSMLIALFFGIFLFVSGKSFLDAIIVFGTIALLTGFISLATYLITGGKSDS